MSDTELQFRTSTFGGFQKQDVLNYIETSNQEHREKLEAVRRELAEAEAAKAAQAEETAAAQAQTEAKEKELQALRGELARQDEGLDKLTKSCCAELTHRAPDPLPLDEK